MTIETIYQLRHKQTWGDGGKPQENVYFFQHTAGTGVAADLANDFGTAFVPAIAAIQSSALKNVSINVLNLGDLGDFAEPALVGSGAISGEALPPFASIGYTMKLNTRAVRHGGKRYSGIPESVQSFGVIGDSTYLAAMETLRLLLQDELVSAGDTWLPVVIKRVRTAVSGTTPTQYTYRLPVDDSELVIGEVSVVLTSPNITHQTSREV